MIDQKTIKPVHIDWRPLYQPHSQGLSQMPLYDNLFGYSDATQVVYQWSAIMFLQETP
jgi:hypothetical protein